MGLYPWSAPRAAWMIPLMRIPGLSLGITPESRSSTPFERPGGVLRFRPMGPEDAALVAKGFFLERLGWGVPGAVPAPSGHLNPFNRLQHLYWREHNTLWLVLTRLH